MEEYTIINALDKEGKGISVYVKDGIIMDVNGKSGGDVIDAGGNYLLPGLIDMHIHGAGGFGSDLNITEDNLSSMAAFLESRGVTSFLLAASCSLSFLQRMKGLLENSSYLRAHVIGVYFEGPFINMAKKGGLPADSIREPDEALLDELLSYRIEGKPIVKVMTVAPELEGADKIINKLKEAGVVVSFGHSLASFSDAAKYPGCHVTHLYNAQREIDHRKAGLSLYPFRDRSVTAELIADGVHVDMDVVDFTVDTIGDRICLISDGMSFCGLGAGKGKYLGRDIYSDGKACYYSDDNILIGSGCLITKTGADMVKRGATDLKGFVRMASENPARVLGLNKTGVIRKGAYADLIILDKELNVSRVFKAVDPGLKLLSECGGCCR